MTNELLQGYTDRIKKYEIDNKNNFIMIGMNLAEIQNMNLLANSQYKNIKEYAKDEFGYESTTTYNLINVYVKFFQDEYLVKKRTFTYAEFTYTQLTVMLNMNDEQLILCKSNMTVKQIKELRFKKSNRLDSETLENTELSKNDNVITGVFPDKKDSDETEQKQNTIIVTELPKPERVENKTITIEVKSEQNNDFVTLSDIEKIRLLSEEITDLKVSIMFKDSEIRKLQDNMHIQCTMSKKQSEKDTDMINFIYDELYNINNPIQNDKIEMLLNQIHNYTKNNALPQKINFMQNVI
ncbi:hypothetical protein DSECCO2_607910 [anaerobic digester metagenome]